MSLTNTQFQIVLLLVLHLAALGCSQEKEAPRSNSPSRTSGKIAPGTNWETTFSIRDSNVEGPTVLVVGGMHGNEPAGSRAAEQILEWPIVTGKLIVISKANVLALEANTRLTPGLPEAERNLNRNFPSTPGAPTEQITPRGELARALWRFAVKAKPDWVIDLHEGFDFHASHNPPDGEKKSVGSSIIYQGSEALDPIVGKMLEAANGTVTDPEKRFVPIRGGPVSTGLASACIRVLGAKSMILETTYKGQAMELRTQQHRLMVRTLFRHLGMIRGDDTGIETEPSKPN